MQDQNESIAAALGKIYLDKWYKIFIVFGYGTFLLAGAGLLPLFDAKATSLISLGAALLGTGEFINHPFQTALGAGYQLTGYPRKPCLSGTFLDVIASGLIILGCYRLIVLL